MNPATPGRLRLRATAFYGVSLPVLLVSALTAVAIGSTPLDWHTIMHVCLAKTLPAAWVGIPAVSPADQVIVWLIRIPRVIVAMLVGAGLTVLWTSHRRRATGMPAR